LEFEVDLAALKAAKTDGELEVKSPVPASFGGDQQAWGMLVRATATAQRLEQKLAGVSSRAASDRARTRILKQEVERRETAPERSVTASLAAESRATLQRARSSEGWLTRRPIPLVAKNREARRGGGSAAVGAARERKKERRRARELNGAATGGEEPRAASTA